MALPIIAGSALASDGSGTSTRRKVLDLDPIAGVYKKRGAGDPVLQSVSLSSLTTFARTGTATDWNASGVLGSIASGTLRNGYNPSTLAAAGWLLEGAATNLGFNTSAFSVSASPNDSTVATAAGTAPDGTNSAVSIIPSTASGNHAVFRSFAGATSTLYCFSVHAKANGYNNIRLALENTAFGANAKTAIFTLTGAGSVAASDSGASATITALGNGWYRCALTATSLGSAGTYVHSMGALPGTAATFAGDGTSGVLVWGW